MEINEKQQPDHPYETKRFAIGCRALSNQAKTRQSVRPRWHGCDPMPLDSSRAASNLFETCKKKASVSLAAHFKTSKSRAGYLGVWPLARPQALWQCSQFLEFVAALKNCAARPSLAPISAI